MPLISSQSAMETNARGRGAITYGRSYCGKTTTRKFLTMKLAPPKIKIAPSASGR